MTNLTHISATAFAFLLFVISYVLKSRHPNSSSWWVVVVILLLLSTAFIAAWNPS